MGAKHTYLNSPKTYIKWRITKSYRKNPSLYKEATQKYKRVELNKAIENGVEQYNTNVEFKNKIDSAIEIERQKFNEKQAKKWKDCNEKLGPEGRTARQNKRNETLGHEGRSKSSKKSAETLGPEGRTARQNKRNETLGPEGRSKSAKKSAETFKNRDEEFKNAVLQKRQESYAARTEEQRLETKNKLNNNYKDRSTAMEKRAVNMGAEKLTNASKKSAMCLYEWSNGIISKGPGKKFIIKKYPDVYIIKMIRFDDSEHPIYFKRWEKEFKREKKGCGKGHTNMRVICPDGKISTPSGASRYCKTQGLDYSKCVPLENLETV
jgi:hypothetical protein